MASASEIKNLLDNELKPDKLGKTFEEINKNAIGFFQKLFVEQLNFDLIEGDFGEIGEDIPIDYWNKAAEAQKAYLISEKDDFRIIYVTIKRLRRNRERSAIGSLKRERWAVKGEYICIFYAEESAIWHMVCPHYTEGRTIIRRYILGSGENHRTVSENLAIMDASFTEPLFNRVQEAFKIQVVTEKFYERYKEVFEEIKDHLLDQKIEVSEAKKCTHLLLNRFMFIYFIQKKSWINNDKNFMLSYLNKYLNSGEQNHFYEKWLKKLFFVAMSVPISDKSINEFDNDVNNILNNIPFLNGGLFEKYDVDKLKFSLSDDLLFTVIENFLEEYNFTITEESPFDLDIAIDPAMLGKIYESLIAEEERGKSGIFYTPRIEVDLMCRLGIYEYLIKDKHGVLPEEEDTEDNLIDFIFLPLEEWNPEKNKFFEYLRKALNNLKVLDPACGSGAFLVGMLQVLLELYKKLGVKLDYDFKENILYNSLYGADIKDWAVRMAEFRLWLALIESESSIPTKRPILPNFSFKLHIGDSLIQKIGNVEVNLKQYRGKISNALKKDLQQIKKLKKEYFKGKKEFFDKIKKDQLLSITKDFKIKLQNMKKGTQKDLLGNIANISKKNKENLENEIKQLEEVIKNLESDKIMNLFVWDINFPEIMLTGGFDIVIANPPYIRQEEIIDQSIDLEVIKTMTITQVTALKRIYKSSLIEYVSNNFNINLSKKCDYYVYFFYKAIELADKEGIIVFISSNSWLDVQFGKDLQKGLLKNTHLKFIIDNLSKRSFQSADINTIITVLSKKNVLNRLFGNSKFVAFSKPYEDVINIINLKDILLDIDKKKKIKFFNSNLTLKETKDYRVINLTEPDLWKLGCGSIGADQRGLLDYDSEKIAVPVGEYLKSKWSKFLKAPEIYFKIIKEYEDHFIPLGEIATFTYGEKTGANDFFFLGKPGASHKYFKFKFNENNGELLLFLKHEKLKNLFKGIYVSKDQAMFQIEKEYWMHTLDTEPEDINDLFDYVYKDNKIKWVPNYLIKSPKELTNFMIPPKKFTKICLLIPNNNIKRNVKKYINWGESMEYNTRPSCNRTPWYSLNPNAYEDIICVELIHDRYFFANNKFNLLYDHTVYGFSLEQDTAIYGAILNSTLTALFMEFEGRTTYGDGALGLMQYEYKDLLTIKPDKIIGLSDEDKEILESFFNGVSVHSFDSIFSELGVEKSECFDLNNVKPNRRRVDKIIFEKILNLNLNEQIEIYKGILNLVKLRLEKAKSV